MSSGLASTRIAALAWQSGRCNSRSDGQPQLADACAELSALRAGQVHVPSVGSSQRGDVGSASREWNFSVCAEPVPRRSLSARDRRPRRFAPEGSSNLSEPQAELAGYGHALVGGRRGEGVPTERFVRATRKRAALAFDAAAVLVTRESLRMRRDDACRSICLGAARADANGNAARWGRAG